MVKWHTSSLWGSRGFQDQLAIALGPRMVTMRASTTTVTRRRQTTGARGRICKQAPPTLLGNGTPLVPTIGWETGLRGLTFVGHLSYPGKLSEAQLMVQLQIHVTSKWGGVF